MEESRSESLTKKLKNNKVISLLIVAGVVITSLSSFADSFEKLFSKVSQFTKDEGFKVTGEILFENGAEPVENVLVTILWGMDRATDEGGDTSFQSSVISKVDAGSGQLSYQLKLTKNPPDELLMHLDEVKLGIGYIIAFDDKNHNGFFDQNEEIIGGAPKHAITYLDGDLKLYAETKFQRLKTLRQLKQGYRLNKSVTPEEHGLPVFFDDLLPIDNKAINIMILRDKSRIEFPEIS